MRQRQNFDSMKSSNNLQNNLSISVSRSNIQKLDSHIKSTLPFLHGKEHKKYIYVKIHNSFRDNNEQNSLRLIEMLEEQFENKIEIKHFIETKELLNDKYDDNELHYIIVPQKHLAWAETFARQEREQSQNKKKIYVYGILKKNIYNQKIKARSKKKVEKVPDYIEYFYFQDEDYPQLVTRVIEEHLTMRLRQEGNHAKTWALTNKYAGKKIKKRTIHFYYQVDMQNELAGLYKTYKKKSKSSWIQIYPYQIFQDVLKKIREREIAFNKEIDTAKKVATSKMLKSSVDIEPLSMKSVFMEGTTSQLNSSILGSSIRAINKLDQNDVNIIISRGGHNDIQKFRSLVRVQKYGNWFLWQIQQGNANFWGKIRDFLNEQMKSNEQLQAEQYQRIVHSKSLFILSHINDINTYQMFHNQRNIMHNMQLLPYSDSDEFSLLLREGVKSSQDFVIAVVPGGFKSFATQYAKVIYQFDAKYKNIDCVQNYKFISNANGKHVSNIASSNLLGTQSNLTYYEDNTYLQTLMRERDKHFHPFEGLKGVNVYLLIKETIQHQLFDLKDYISKSPRLHLSTYIDKEFLQKQIKTLTLKDSVIVITDDSTLREAQFVLKNFDEVSILNITDRQKTKTEIKVIAQGDRNHIYNLIKEIPEIDQDLQDQVYEQNTPDKSYVRKNKVMPKKFNVEPGNTISVRLPSHLKDEQSQKMQIRLQKYFNYQIKIQYYKQLKDVRLINKLEEPLSFIIWSDINKNKQSKAKQMQYLKTLAKNEKDQLRQQFIIYSEQAEEFKYLVLNEAEQFQRFKFVSSRWQRIEEYIIGTYKNYANIAGKQQFIYNDQMIRVFFNDKDKSSKEMINLISKRRDNNDLNPANHIQFHLIEDLLQVIAEQSPFHKYYIIHNESFPQNIFTTKQLLDIIQSHRKDNIHYIRLILIDVQKQRKTQTRIDQRIRKHVINYTAAGQWLGQIKVYPTVVDYIVPHVIIDKHTLSYYYFLDKYSSLTRRFTFAFCNSKEQIKKQITSRKGRSDCRIWIIAKTTKKLSEYMRFFQRCQNYENACFICEFNDALINSINQKVIFKNETKRQIQKFLLNIYRRDKRIFFPSSVTTDKVILVIMNDNNNRIIPINKQQLSDWQQILQAKIENIVHVHSIAQCLKNNPSSLVYLVYPYRYEKQVYELSNVYANLRRIVLMAFPHYDARKLRDNFVPNNNQIYIGTYPAEITQFLRYLRYNIRRSQATLEKTIPNELIEINTQKEYKLTDSQIKYLTTKNDSIIINNNGYEINDLSNLLNKSLRYNYLQIFIGDHLSNKLIIDFNDKKKKDIKFIDAKASPFLYSKNEKKTKETWLQTNERDEMVTYLNNVPENRYYKAITNKGLLSIYCNKNQSKLLHYLPQLSQIRNRNQKITVKEYDNIETINSSLKEPGVILIHSSSEKEYLQRVKPVNNINYMILNEDYSGEKNYASYGNKYFITKKPKEFTNFINQINISNQFSLEPMALHLDNSNNTLLSIEQYNSIPIHPDFFNISIYRPFNPKVNEPTEEYLPLQLRQGLIDNRPPTLLNIQFPMVDLPSLPLGKDILKKMKDSASINDNAILDPRLDEPPSRTWFNIKSNPDSFNLLPKSIFIPKPAPPLRLKLAILHPNTLQFTNIGEMLKRNLDPSQYSVTLITFKSQHELQEYSKNNGQKLNGYDKIVVFLSNIYRKYDNTLKVMKTKLNNRMQYFIFDDNFHLNNHSLLKHHLKPYRIKNYSLPYSIVAPNKYLSNANKIFVLVLHPLLANYEELKSGHVNVIGYNQKQEIIPYLHRENSFVFIVTNKENYHNLKLNSKISPRCRLIIQTNKELPEDELYLHRICHYSLYYGPDGKSYLKKIIPSRPSGHIASEDIKFLYYSLPEEQIAFREDYQDFQHVYYQDWKELYSFLVLIFKNKNNWLLKNSPGRPEIIPLHPKAYLENKAYMKQFKNDFKEKGYLNEERVGRKSTLVTHQYADLPQLFYTDQKDLIKQLQKQEATSVVLFNSSNLKIGSLRMKFVRHKWIGITDNSERWIDSQGDLPDISDEQLLRKQDMFTNMFNNYVFDSYNDMQYYYLSNKAHIDHNRNIYFRNKEDLTKIFQTEHNLLMVIFVQAKDINHIPQAILAESTSKNGRVKLILLRIDFVDDFQTLYIKFNEIDPVIKHINAVESAGRIDFLVYNENDGQKTRQVLIQRRKLRNFQNKPYANMIQVDQIARNIKGKYKKVYVVCIPDEKQEIEQIFKTYAIQNKGIPSQGVQFIFIDRLSTIKPNLSHISAIKQHRSKSQIRDSSESNKKDVKSKDMVQQYESRQLFVDNGAYGLKKDRENEEYEIPYVEEEYELPNTQSNIKENNKIDQIIANKHFVLNINQKLKGLFPPIRFHQHKVNYFANRQDLQQPQEGVHNIVISTQNNPSLAQLSENPDNFLVLIGKESKNLFISNNNNAMMIKEEQIQSFIKKLQDLNNSYDQLNNMLNIDDFSKVRVVYDKNMDIDSKRKLLAASEKNNKIYPIMYKGIKQLKEYMEDPDSLLLLMMSYDPEHLQDTAAKQNKVIIKKKKLKMIISRKYDSGIHALETILQEEETDQQNQAIKKLTNAQVDIFLKIYENTQGERPPVTNTQDWQNQRQNQYKYEQPADLDHITKLNVHSNIRPEIFFREDEMQKLKERLTGDLIVLIIDKNKRLQVDEAVSKYNVLVQAYTNSMNLQNDIRDRKDNVSIAVIDRNMLDKIGPIKKKYPHAAFILESDSPNQDGIQQYRPYLAGQIRKISDIEKIIADIYHENERLRYNAESLRAASRFDYKKTSIVDYSNNQRFSVGLSNQKSKKVFLFYKEPQNSHIKTKLSDTFSNINFIAYKNVSDFKRLIGTYNTYSSILIANGSDIFQLEDFVSKKKEMIYVIRFNPPADLKDNNKVKKLFSTYKRDDLQKFIFDEFQKYSYALPNDNFDFKYKTNNRNVEGKKYTQKYEPNTFGTTPRFHADFIPPKSKEATYSRNGMKSNSRSKLSSRLQAINKKSPRNLDFYHQ